MGNTNCLEGKRCPQCGSYGPFYIYCTIYADVLMCDEGTIEEYDRETTWEKDSPTRCQECGYSGEMKDFKE
jgi:hypothetical protein